MNRPSRVWRVFALCVGLVLAALGWASQALWRLEQAQLNAERRADLEERARLALWRMDTAVNALLLQESARLPEREPSPQPDRPPPSAPDRGLSSHVILRFQLALDGRLLAPLEGPAEPPRLAELRRLLDQPAATGSKPAPAVDNGMVLVQESGRPEADGAPLPVPEGEGASSRRDEEAAQTFRNYMEFSQRAQGVQQAQQVLASRAPAPAASPLPLAAAAAGRFQPLWLGEHLVLVRRALSRAGPVVQGVWVDWPALRTALLDSIRDLFGAATLGAVPPQTPRPRDRLLATLPACLEPSPAASPAAGWTPLRVTLSLAWAGVLVAVLSVATLLRGALRLSERRGAFVSAVTHELRTPLTTFKLYSEMLAGDMVPDEATRRQYLATLCREAERLRHLVENVLAYARLDQARPSDRTRPVRVRTLLDAVRPRLAERTAQARLELVERVDDPGLLERIVRVDPAAVEQILFNLVDNACKYAASAASADRRLHLDVSVAAPSSLALGVRDHGPGVDPALAGRLFEPFSKSADQAARSAPGVGLGLALSGALSRDLGGDLHWDARVQDGARFVLTLPLRGPPPRQDP